MTPKPEEDLYYNVRIIDEKRDGLRKLYLIDWGRNYPPSWEPTKNVGKPLLDDWRTRRESVGSNLHEDYQLSPGDDRQLESTQDIRIDSTESGERNDQSEGQRRDQITGSTIDTGDTASDTSLSGLSIRSKRKRMSFTNHDKKNSEKPTPSSIISTSTQSTLSKDTPELRKVINSVDVSAQIKLEETSTSRPETRRQLTGKTARKSIPDHLLAREYVIKQTTPRVPTQNGQNAQLNSTHTHISSRPFMTTTTTIYNGSHLNERNKPGTRKHDDDVDYHDSNLARNLERYADVRGLEKLNGHMKGYKLIKVDKQGRAVSEEL